MLIDITKENRDEIKRTLDENIFDYDDPPEEKDGIINIEENGELIPILNKQGLLLIIGKTKVRKSTFLGMLVASAKKGEKVGKIVSDLKGDIVWFDTEQAGIEFYNMQKMVRNMCGEHGNIPSIRSHSLVRFPTIKEKLAAIDVELESREKVGMFVVDTIKDLVLDSGDEATSKQVLEYLRSFTVKYDCGLATVLHTDKLGKDAVGRMGTLTKEKGAYTLKLELDRRTNESIISADATRGKSFKSFRIRHADDGKTIKFVDDVDVMGNDTGKTEEVVVEDFSGDTDDLPF